ncbi:hypothetical protein [Cryptosporangium aurantiacum]|uniref:Transmembrane protein n=1 Tax=Cryptosporangium aurantiacum TaxID=134849 RepID=A0A1M7RER3_9ACTN|nr:hypothetical protein [Cryptosporangium aurantiacum]SHN44671.1 hypothetical protein SAMN05443668_110316 [Cryptosporangium aurantiacum]
MALTRRELVTLPIWVASYLLFGAGLGIVADSVQHDIHNTGDAVYAAVRFPLLGLALMVVPWLRKRSGLSEKPSSPRIERLAAYALGALVVASAAWLVIDFDAPGWRRVGLACITLSGLGGALIVLRATLLRKHQGLDPAGRGRGDGEELRG